MCIYEKAFKKIKEHELTFRSDLGEVPDFFNWQNKLVILLQNFYEMTMRISSF